MQLHMQGDGMRRKRLPNLAIILLLFLSCFLNILYIDESSADDLYDFYVSNDYKPSTPGWGVTHFDKIQNAINKSNNGNRILVLNGTYYENIIINRTSLSVFGEDPINTIIEATSTGNAVTITNPSVALSKFTIMNSGSDDNNAVVYINGSYCKIIDTAITGGKHGIYINNSVNTTIHLNTIESNSGNGVYLFQSDNSTIKYNTITDNEGNGIFSYNSSDNTIRHNPSIKFNKLNGVFLNDRCKNNAIKYNNISENKQNGIYLNKQCNYNIDISHNDIYNNKDNGIKIINSSNNQLTSNTVQCNKNYGIMIVGSNNKIENSNISKNRHGLFLFADDNSIIINNNIHSNSHDGIRLQNSTGNNISTNRITDNSRYGVYIDYFATGNKIFNNYFEGNKFNAEDISDVKNYWNITIEPGPNIIKGPNISGNYWCDYTGCDITHNGLGNTLYKINDTIVGNVDYYPLVISPSVLTYSPPKDEIVSVSVEIHLTFSKSMNQITTEDNFSIDPQVSGNFVWGNNNTTMTFTPASNLQHNTNYNIMVDKNATDSQCNVMLDDHKWNFITIPEIIPGPPKNFDTTGEGRFMIDISWTKGVDASRTYIEYNQTSDTWERGNGTMIYDGTGELYSHTGLDSATTYYYQAWSYNATSGLWNETYVSDNATTGANQAPDFGNPNPLNDSKDRQRSFTWSIAITDPEGDTFNWTIECSNGENSGGTAETDGIKSLTLSGLDYETEYTIWVNATDEYGAETKEWFKFTTKAEYIPPPPPPEPVPLKANAGGPYNQTKGLPIIFNGVATGGTSPYKYSWDFGDGSTGTGTRPAHTYTTAGTYTATLTVIDENSDEDEATATVIISEDTTPPEISIIQHGLLYPFQNIYKFKAYITDNVAVKNVTIKYWYAGCNIIRTAEMENTITEPDIYQKKITADQVYDRIYCIIYAYDTSGNVADTKKPFVDHGGPYENYFVLQNIVFNASGSFDLDGNITEYAWNFGDGTTGTGEIIKHKYLTDGNYTVTLTITDDDGNTTTDTTYALIDEGKKIEPSSEIINKLKELYNITGNFFAYDTDGDGKVDTFFDPAGVLKDVKGSVLTLNNNSVFLLSLDDPYVPEFMWDINTTADTDSIITIKEVKVDNVEPVEKGDTATVTVTIDKNKSWICLHISDNYPHAPLTVKVNDTIISEDMIWRKNSRIYVLDNPGTEYHFIYEGIITPETLKWIRFTPAAYGTIDENNPTITIEYNVPVTIEYADIVSLYISEDEIIPITVTITSELQTSDYKTYTYTPDRNLPSGEYEIHIEARDEAGNLWRNNSFYSFISYEYEEQGSNIFSIIPYLGFIIGIGIAVFLLSKKFNINLKSFVYIKNRKIIPFFKPVIFGPLSLDIDHKHIKKAEFYVNGQLKDTLTQEPYVWKWDEPAFMKQKIETKIYDQEGNSNSSGEMTFYMFNPKLFK
jgi:parallel beta-helix repeat protein